MYSLTCGSWGVCSLNYKQLEIFFFYLYITDFWFNSYPIWFQPLEIGWDLICDPSYGQFWWMFWVNLKRIYILKFLDVIFYIMSYWYVWCQYTGNGRSSTYIELNNSKVLSYLWQFQTKWERMIITLQGLGWEKTISGKTEPQRGTLS